MYLSKDKIKMLIKVFSELPYDVLWKFEDDKLEDKPPNVWISKWFPQQDVLSHPNVKLFINQGGLQSMGEALTYGVPALIMPFISDQYTNAYQLARLGVCLHLDFKSITEESFKSAILEVIENER